MRRMTLGLAAAVVLAMVLAPAGVTQAQDNEAKYNKKISEQWVKDGGWILDFEEAKAKAAETGKPIFAYFSRSYAP